jgi:hypothetical protein
MTSQRTARRDVSAASRRRRRGGSLLIGLGGVTLQRSPALTCWRGWPPVIIVGGSGTAAFVLRSLTYLRWPLMPEVVLPAFLLTVAGLQVHWFLGAITPISNSMGQLTGRSLRGFTPVPCSKVWHGENERSATVSCI